MDINSMRDIILLSKLRDQMLEKIQPLTKTAAFNQGEYIFKEDEKATRLYAIISGEVILELEKNSSTQVLINTITRGRTFGFSSLVDTSEKKYTSSARAVTDLEVFVWNAEDLEGLFHQDCELGLRFMKRVAKIIKTRLQIRNAQFIDAYIP